MRNYIQFLFKKAGRDLTAPRLTEEAKNLAIKVTAENVLPELLPKNAEKIVLSIYRTGKDVGIVKSPSYAILIIGASCYGGDFLENIAYSTLTSCQNYVKNIKDYYAYQGQTEDLVYCHQDAISKLNLAKNSPNVLFQHVETETGNLVKKVKYEIDSTACKITSFFSGESCDTSVPKFSQSSYNDILNQIQSLNKTVPNINEINSWSQLSASQSSDRLLKKERESGGTITSLNSDIVNVEEKLSEYDKFNGLYLSFLNFILRPEYDFTDAENNLYNAKRKLDEANILHIQYKFNSAINVSGEGQQYIRKSLGDVKNQESIARDIKWEVVLPIIFIIGLIWWIKTH